MSPLGSGTLLILLAATTRASVGAAIYAASVSALLGVSALYHRVTWTAAARRRMRRLDHAMIFLLIAGTHTPVGLMVLKGTLATVVLAVVWGGAVAGIARTGLDGGAQMARRDRVSGPWLDGGGGHAAAVRPTRRGRRGC